MRYRKPPQRKQYIPDRSIRDLPLSVFRIPPNEWIISLRREDGTRETRKVRGTLFDARKHRDEALRKGKYTEAWISEGKEHRVLKKKQEPQREERQLPLGLVFDDEPYYSKNDF